MALDVSEYTGIYDGVDALFSAVENSPWSKEENYIAAILLFFSYNSIESTKTVLSPLWSNFSENINILSEGGNVPTTKPTIKKMQPASLQSVTAGWNESANYSIEEPQNYPSMLEYSTDIARQIKEGYSERYVSIANKLLSDYTKEKIENGEREGEPLPEYYERKVTDSNHWKLVAAAAMSRSYHYGFYRATQSQGLTQCQLVAQLDHRTSKICRSLHGTTFYVANAIATMEDQAKLTLSDLKTSYPWAKNVTDLNTDQRLPPFHARCRTTVHIVG